MGRLAAVVPLVVAVIALTVAPSRDAAAAPLLAVPDTVRVNIAGLGGSYAKIGATGSFTVTTPEGTVAYRGSAFAVTRLGVQRLTDPARTVVTIPDPGPSAIEDRRNRAAARRAARLDAVIEGLAIVTVPFELSIETAASGSPAPPLLSAKQVIPLRFTADAGLLTLDGKAFRGTLELSTDDEGDMIVVNTVDTGSYLASVVGSEEPGSWMAEALAAQAIAARTYLVTHLRGHRTYDLEGDTRDQQYDGIAGEVASTVRAVQLTRGQVATYRGVPIEALYSASAGGVTEDSENVFGNVLPYLRSVPSPADDVAKDSGWGQTSWVWRQEYTAPQLEHYMAARGVFIGSLQRIEITQLSPTGRVMGARVIGTTGSRDIGKDRTRYYFGLRSTLFTIATQPETTEIVAAADFDRVRELQELGARVERTFVNDIRDPDRELGLRVEGWQYRLPARFVFDGKGFGHGVGMSQWGAQGMALAGATAAQILTHYYLGIAITSVGGP
jgi:stage II sporulation protein D